MKTNLIVALAAMLSISACGEKESKYGHHHQSTPLWQNAATAITGMGAGVEGVDVVGMIMDGPHGMMLRIDITGISEGFHGIHLHQVGDCSDASAGFKASGSHINPGGRQHGLLNPEGFEVADLPNIYAHHSGHARAELFVSGLSAADAIDADGFAIVVHESPDDHATQPIGGAGARLACVAFNNG